MIGRLGAIGPLLLAASGLLFVAISVPLIRQQVRPNRWYGFRTPKTLSSPEIWYPANRAAGIDLLVAGVVIFLACVVLAIVGRRYPHLPTTAIAFGVFVASLGGAFAVSMWRLSKM